MLDVELAAERLTIATRRLAEVGGPHGEDRDVLLEGLRGLAAASATGTPHAMVPALLVQARDAVAGLTADTRGREERTQRVAFAVHRLADTLATVGHPEQDVAAAVNAPTTASARPDPDRTTAGPPGAATPDRATSPATKTPRARTTGPPPSRTPNPRTPTPRTPMSRAPCGPLPGRPSRPGSRSRCRSSSASSSRRHAGTGPRWPPSSSSPAPTAAGTSSAAGGSASSAPSAEWPPAWASRSSSGDARCWPSSHSPPACSSRSTSCGCRRGSWRSGSPRCSR